MIDKKYLLSLKKQLHLYANVRRDVIKVSGDALHHAKRAIFALHRDDTKEAKQKLAQCEKLLKQLAKKHKSHPAAQREGSYNAALEEYVEATLFLQFLNKGTMSKITSLSIADEIYLAGLCDVPGELYRYAVRAATANDLQTVKKCAEMGTLIVGELIEFNLTKYLRTKFDQAKAMARKLEYVVYELSLRDKA